MNAIIYLNQQITYVHHLAALFLIIMFLIIGLTIFLNFAEISLQIKRRYTIVISILGLLQTLFGIFIYQQNSGIPETMVTVIKMEKLAIEAKGYDTIKGKSPTTIQELGLDIADQKDTWGYPFVIEPEKRLIRSVGLEQQLTSRGYSANDATVGY